jgi:hypothetical protein
MLAVLHQQPWRQRVVWLMLLRSAFCVLSDGYQGCWLAVLLLLLLLLRTTLAARKRIAVWARQNLVCIEVDDGQAQSRLF